ncbi:MAG: hypothetical protein BGO08_09545 [Altererythrobacter sp. 66-12]|nr:MAG: hypothetical protein BGO08_09545 [Altererythrobacter sp. 66-12]
MDTDDRAGLRRFNLIGTGIIFLITLLAGPLIFVAWHLGALPDGMESKLVAVALFLLLSTSLLRFSQEIMRGARKIVLSQLFEQLVWPLGMLVAGIYLFAFGAAANALDMAMLHASMFLLCWLALLGLTFRLVGSRQGVRERSSDASAQEWLGLGFPLAISGLLAVFLKRGDILALGAMSSPDQVAPYAAAVRVSGLTIFGLAAASAASAPMMRSYWKQQDINGLQGCIDRSASIATLFSLPLVLIFLIAPEFLLSVFGPAYRDGATALRILGVGQLVNAITGPAAPLMVATGMQRLYLATSLFSAIFMVVALALLLPRFGAAGAAAAAAMAVMSFNGALVLIISQRLKVRSYATLSTLNATLREGAGAFKGIARRTRARMSGGRR